MSLFNSDLGEYMVMKEDLHITPVKNNKHFLVKQSEDTVLKKSDMYCVNYLFHKVSQKIVCKYL